MKYGDMHRVKKKQAVTVPVKTGQYISTIDAAKMCGVSTFSVQRWFDEGLLIGAKLPGGKRKIMADSLKRFMHEHGLLPAEGTMAGNLRVLIVDRDAKTLYAIKEYLSQSGVLQVQTASNGLDAGLTAAEFKPDVVILNIGIKDMPVHSFIQRFRQSPVTHHARLVAIANKGYAEEAIKAGASVFLTKPLDLTALVKAVKA